MDDISFRTEIVALAASAANANESLTLDDFAALDVAWHTRASTKKIINELITDGKLVRRGSRYFAVTEPKIAPIIATVVIIMNWDIVFLAVTNGEDDADVSECFTYLGALDTDVAIKRVLDEMNEDADEDEQLSLDSLKSNYAIYVSQQEVR